MTVRKKIGWRNDGNNQIDTEIYILLHGYTQNGNIIFKIILTDKLT